MKTQRIARNGERNLQANLKENENDVLEVDEIELVVARLGQFQQLLKTRVIIILNFTRCPCDYLY